MKRSRWGVTSFVLVAVGLGVATARPAGAVGGDLDLGFGTGGKLTTDFAATADEARAVAIQADGKIVTAGSAIGTNADFALARYRPDGTLDPTFGTGGKVRTDFGSSEQAFAVALQPDGKILAAGGGNLTNSGFHVARYNADGSLDATFGTGGKVTTSFGFGPIFQRAHGLLVQPDGKIVAVGTAASQPGATDFALVRYNANGTLDAAFGIGGKVTTDFGSATAEFAWAVALQPDGRLVVAGSTGAVGGDVFALARYTPSGTLDATFGTGGKVTAGFGGTQDWAQAVALQPDGRIVVAGKTGNQCCLGTFDFALARFSAAGSLDPTFGTGGKVTTDFDRAIDNARAVILQADGAIVAAGERLSGGGVPGATFDFALARFQANGGLDGTFGIGGKVTTDFPGRNDSVFGLALQQDGQIVAAGASSTDFALARYSPGDPASADLVVTQTDAPDPVAVNETLTYDITVRNNGPSAATGVTLTDTLSTGVELASPPPGCTSSSGVVTCSLGTLGAGAAATVTISVTARESGTLANIVTVAATETDPQPANNTATVTTTVRAPSVDVAVSGLQGTPDPVIVGQEVSYTMVVGNRGPDTATGVVLTDVLPAGVNFVAASSGQGACTNDAGTVRCAIGTLPTDLFPTVVIRVTSTTPGPLTNTVTVAATETDPQPANNTATVTTTVRAPSVDVDVGGLQGTPDPVIVGEEVSYTMVVGNRGPDTATGVVLTDVLPAGVNFVAASSGQGACTNDAGTVRCAIGTLPTDLFPTVVIRVTSTTPGPLTNTVTVAATETDPQPANNTATVTTTVRAPSVDVDVGGLQGTPDPVIVGEEVSYVMVVGNRGPDTATGVVLTDVLPAGVNFVAASSGQGPCTHDAGTVRCAIGTLPTDVLPTVVIRVTSTTPGTLANTVTVAATETDPQPANNTATVTTTVRAQPQILFTSTRDGNSEIYSMNADGAGLVRLSNHSALDANAAWSPDRSRIAFVSTRHGNFEIYTMNANGTGLTRLTNHARTDLTPSWSPDGSKITFSSDRDGNFEIYTMNANGTGLTRLTNHARTDLTPSWSPDGSKITFSSDRDGNFEIYTMNANGTGLTRLTNHARTDLTPWWSPDGSKITFSSDRDGNFEIYTMNANGTGLTRLTNHARTDLTPSWSPDGSKITFSSDRDGNFEIYTMNANGTGLTRLTNHASFDGLPDP